LRGFGRALASVSRADRGIDHTHRHTHRRPVFRVLRSKFKSAGSGRRTRGRNHRVVPQLQHDFTMSNRLPPRRGTRSRRQSLVLVLGSCVLAPAIGALPFRELAQSAQPEDARASATAPAKDSAPRSTDIVLGMSTALSGPASELGNDMLAGVDSALAEVERDGGIRGRRVRLIALDDGYEPDRAGRNVRELVERDKVIAIVGNVGTPTAVASVQITNASGTPFFGAFTGAGLLRKSPPDRSVINFRASYAEEIEAMVAALIDGAGIAPSDIAFFTQRDAYGDSGFVGGLVALRAHGLTDESAVLHVRYERNTVAVEKAVAEILVAEHPPRAVIMVGAYRPTAAFVKLAKAHGVGARFLSVSFAGPQSLLRQLGDAGEGVIVTQVVPDLESDAPIVAEYRRAFAIARPGEPVGYVSLEGYVAARILCRALASIDGTIDRAAVVSALEQMGTFDIGLGEPLKLARDEHQACHRVWPTIIRAGKIVSFDWAELRESR
jgi:ABC-type branched-subunit amino acid transport system substrate-binding protein